ncbi:hypothetical protein GGH12_004631 [Coemansia sp. RSA 1822]|nr:hypothetical protein LPJ76_004864 [Coemansia sp. RSA 638]KAJ2540178.1 hypothetical protein GGF49_004663 [Coemansia sp. RSA 1853]KAJ2560653.1 hypothetical protein GGH12_004631 [Coemansia sp. RSA 1822]
MAELMFIAGARFASIVLSSVSAFASIVVIASYTRSVLRMRAHHRRIIGAKPPIKLPRTTCFSYDSVAAAPCDSGVRATRCFSYESVGAPPYAQHVYATRQSIIGSEKMREYARPSVSPSEKMREYTRPSVSASEKMREYTRPSISLSEKMRGYARPSGSEKIAYAYPQPSAALAYRRSSLAEPAQLSDWSLGSAYKPPRAFRRIHLPCPIEYYNRMAACISLERLPLPAPARARRDRTVRRPSAKTAIFSLLDLFVHIGWIANTTSTSCPAPLFFLSASMLVYVFVLALFACTSVMRLRDMPNATGGTRRRRVDMCVVGGAVAGAVVISLLPAVMNQATYDAELRVCWFVRGPEAARWVWMALNAWIVLALFLLCAASVCIAVLLTNERRSLLRSLDPTASYPEPEVTPPWPGNQRPSVSPSRCERCCAESEPSMCPPLPLSARSAGPHMPPPQTMRAHKHMSLPIGSLPTHRPLIAAASRPPTLQPTRPSTLHAARPPTLHTVKPQSTLHTTNQPPSMHSANQPPTLRSVNEPPTLRSTNRPPPLHTHRPAHPQSSIPPAIRSTTGQLHRIEQRIHVLISAGALRVGMRATVPLLTQLPLVIWSTLHTTNDPQLMYAVAILMLSIQGLLDMMLYYIFDTQNDAARVSLPSHIVAPAAGDVGQVRSVSRIQSDVYFAERAALPPHMRYISHARHSVPVPGAPSLCARARQSAHTVSLNGWDESDEQ